MENVVASVDRLAAWSNKIHQEQGNRRDTTLIDSIDEYLEAVEIFAPSLSPEKRFSNDVSIKCLFYLQIFYISMNPDAQGWLKPIC